MCKLTFLSAQGHQVGYLVSERPETKSDVFKTVKFGLKDV